MTIEDIINYLATPRKLEFDDNILVELSNIKKNAVNEKNENVANRQYLVKLNVVLVDMTYRLQK